MKKIMSVLWAMLILLCAAFPAFGAQTSAVFAEDVLLTPGSEATIPVLIEDNAGLMGFKITVEYPVGKIKITSVTKGEVTGKGNFNTNFGIHDGKFDVLWNHVEEVQSDGTLFVLTARAVADFTDPAEIKLTFSQGDTFNEAYEDVVLNCRNIQVGLSAAGASSPESGAPEGGSQNQISYRNEDVVAVVQETLRAYGYDSMQEVRQDERDAFLNQVNAQLSVISGGTYAPVDNYESLVSLYNSAYEGVFISDVTQEIPGNEIQQAIQDALDRVGAATLQDLPEDKRQDFVVILEDNLNQHSGNVAQISKEIGTDEAIEIAQKLSGALQSAPTQAPDENGENEQTGKIWILVAALAVVAAGAVCVIVFFVKKKKDKAPRGENRENA